MRLSCAFIAAAATLVLLPSCGQKGDSASAEACARVVKEVRGIRDRVEVIGTPLQTAEGQVEIVFEYVDDQKLTVAGSASCAFAVGGPGSLELIGAIVDRKPLDGAGVTAANRALSKPRL